jgi:molybdate transport system substrate-binding protein
MLIRNVFLAFFLSCVSFASQQLNIAVSSNFHRPLLKIVEEFKNENKNIEINLTSGSTGRLTSSILYGAPYDLFFAADSKNPKILELRGLVSKDNRKTYARGKIYLLTRTGECVNYIKLLHRPSLKLSIANPKLAPYGQAAKDLFDKLDLWEQKESNLIMGQNISQSYQWFLTGNVDMAVIGNSYLDILPKSLKSNVCNIDPKLYRPIIQQFVLLKKSRAAFAFKEFIINHKIAKSIIRNFGYDVN